MAKKRDRSITIDLSDVTDEQYVSVANLVWHVVYGVSVPAGFDFDISRDGSVSNKRLNDHWAALGLVDRWGSRR